MDGLEKRPSGGFDRAHSKQTKESGKAKAIASKLVSGVRGAFGWLAKTRWAQLVVVVLILAGAGFGLYKYGYAQGENKQKATNDKQRTTSSKQTNGSTTPRPSSPYTSYLGEITELSDSGLTVKAADGNTHKVSYGQSLVVSDAKGAKIDTKSLKKGAKISVTGTEKDGNLSATRIRLRP